MSQTGETHPAPLAVAAPLGHRELLAMYGTMLLARVLTQRMWLLARQGKAQFAVSGDGHEAAQLATAYALDRTQDWVVPYYRDLALVLALGVPPRELMLDHLARAEAPFGQGRQMPAHYSLRRLRIVSGSSTVATQLPHAVGIALASRIRGETAVTTVHFGDGSTSEGDFHEALNFASVHRLAVVFICENNDWAISVPRSRQMAVDSVAERAQAYRMPGVTVDGTDVLESYRAVKEAVDRARAGGGPTLIDARCVRLAAHSSNDDERRYRSPEELAAAQERDPIPRFRAYLTGQGVLTEAEEARLQQEVAQAVDDATEFAEARPAPDPAGIATHVYASS